MLHEIFIFCSGFYPILGLYGSWAYTDAGEIVKYLAEKLSDPGKLVYVVEIAEFLNRSYLDGNILHLGLGERPVTARKVGEIIRNTLGLKTNHTRKGNKGHIGSTSPFVPSRQIKSSFALTLAMLKKPISQLHQNIMPPRFQVRNGDFMYNVFNEPCIHAAGALLADYLQIC